MENKTITILAVSGSLRATSSNMAILKEIKKILPCNVDYIISDKPGLLPHFDDAATIPGIVTEWRNQVAAADAVLFCTPEYAFGVPGTLKNALDWSVGSVAFSDKPIALITASTGGDKAHVALLHTLNAVGTLITGDLLISFVRSKLSEKGEIKDENSFKAIQSLTEKLVAAAIKKRDEAFIE